MRAAGAHARDLCAARMGKSSRWNAAGRASEGRGEDKGGTKSQEGGRTAFRARILPRSRPVTRIITLCRAVALDVDEIKFLC